VRVRDTEIECIYCGVSRSASEEQLVFRGKFIVFWGNFWVVFLQYSILV
jgi:hypothetical protein